MARWFRLEPVDASFFEHAPHVYRFPVDLDVAPERVWASLTSPRSIGAWTPLVGSVQWTSERPFGVGTTRTVTLPLGAVTVHEQYFHWDDDAMHHSFHVTEANRPVLRSLAEDYRVEPRSGGGSRLTWTFALAGTPLTRPGLVLGGPLNALLLRRVAHSARGYFARHPDTDPA